MPVELEDHPFWTIPEEHQQSLIDRCNDVWGDSLRDVYDKTRTTLYSIVDLREAMFPESHRHWNDRDFADNLYVNPGQVCRYRSGKEWPNLQTAEKWFRRLGTHLPNIPTDSIYDAISIDFAVDRWAHEVAMTTSPRVNRRRATVKGLDVDGVDQTKVALVHLLATHGVVHDQWLCQLQRFHADWDVSADDRECDRFLAELLSHIELLFRNSFHKSWFKSAANFLASIDLDVPSETQKLRDLVRKAWNGPVQMICLDPDSVLFRIFGVFWSHSVALHIAHRIILDD